MRPAQLVDPAAPQDSVPPVVLLGSEGVMGAMHARIFRYFGVEPMRVDPVLADNGHDQLHELDWSQAIVDVCTPTATHVTCLAEMYELGARQFIVEKPAALDANSWRKQLQAMPDARVFVAHNYLFSQAFRILQQECSDPIAVSSVFHKDRRADDARGRGAGPDGQLPNVLLIEGPHQFAMALGLIPNLAVTSSRQFLRGRSPAQPAAAAAATVTLRNPDGIVATVHTNLRAPRSRVLRITERDGRMLEARFAISSDLRSTVIERRAGQRRVLYDGPDNMLAATLHAALVSVPTDSIPPHASAGFAELVLQRIDAALQSLPWESAAIAGQRRRGDYHHEQ